MIMEADKSQDLQPEAGDSGEPMVSFQSCSHRLETRKKI